MDLQSDLEVETETLASQMITTIETGDATRLYQLCADEAVIWHNYDDAEVDLDYVVKFLSSVAANVEGLRYTDVRRRAFAGGYLQQHVLTGTRPNGERIHSPACLVVHVSDGRITRIEEYLDSARRVGSQIPQP